MPIKTEFKTPNVAFLIASLIMLCHSSWAKVIPAACFTDHMVLQQQTKANLWGTATPGSRLKVTPSWSTQVYSLVVPASGAWKIAINTPTYGGPYQISFNDGEELTLHDILIGEVWLCSGQSNMEMPLTGFYGDVLNLPQELADADHYNAIRMIKIDNKLSFTPQQDVPVKWGWRVTNAQNVRDFSAVAYFFAKKIYDVKHIPIGLINDTWGGTVAEAWTSGGALKTMPEFADFIKSAEQGMTQEKLDGLYRQNVRTWLTHTGLTDPGYKGTVATWAQVGFDDSSWPKMQLPAYWEQAGVPNYDGTLWFRKKVDIPAAWAGKDVKLKIAGIDDYDVTFFNGVEVDHTEAFFYPRNYILPGGLVKAGSNLIAVRVFDNGGLGGINKGPLTLQLTSDTTAVINLQGEWTYQKGVPLTELQQPPVQSNSPNRPSLICNAMINPLLSFTIKGVIWYQGESNADRAEQYKTLFPLLITDWRSRWHEGNFPFYFVQLANYNAADQPPTANWPELRFAQLNTLKLPNTGMAVTIDIGDPTRIHPQNKQEVGRRLALIALAKTYKAPVAYSGPVYTAQEIKGDQIILSFTHTQNGLLIKGNTENLKGFTIAGTDQHFYQAKARIQGNKVIVNSPQVPRPIAVRYDWQNNPEGNLYNSADLPASPFRTDHWEGIR